MTLLKKLEGEGVLDRLIDFDLPILNDDRAFFNGLLDAFVCSSNAVLNDFMPMSSQMERIELPFIFSNSANTSSNWFRTQQITSAVTGFWS